MLPLPLTSVAGCADPCGQCTLGAGRLCSRGGQAVAAAAESRGLSRLPQPAQAGAQPAELLPCAGDPQPEQLPRPGVCAAAEQQREAGGPQQLRRADQGGAWAEGATMLQVASQCEDTLLAMQPRAEG